MRYVGSGPWAPSRFLPLRPSPPPPLHRGARSLGGERGGTVSGLSSPVSRPLPLTSRLQESPVCSDPGRESGRRRPGPAPSPPARRRRRRCPGAASLLPRARGGPRRARPGATAPPGGQSQPRRGAAAAGSRCRCRCRCGDTGAPEEPPPCGARVFLVASPPLAYGHTRARPRSSERLLNAPGTVTHGFPRRGSLNFVRVSRGGAVPVRSPHFTKTSDLFSVSVCPVCSFLCPKMQPADRCFFHMMLPLRSARVKQG